MAKIRNWHYKTISFDIIDRNVRNIDFDTLLDTEGEIEDQTIADILGWGFNEW